MKTKLYLCYKRVGCLGPAPVRSLVGGSVYMSSHKPRLVDSVGLLVVSLTPPAPSVLLLTPSSLVQVRMLVMVQTCSQFDSP